MHFFLKCNSIFFCLAIRICLYLYVNPTHWDSRKEKKWISLRMNFEGLNSLIRNYHIMYITYIAPRGSQYLWINMQSFFTWIYNETCNSFSEIAMIFAVKWMDSEVSQIIRVGWRFTSWHFTLTDGTYLIIITKFSATWHHSN